MSFYLVDFENVKSDGLKGIDDLTKEDTVVIFYSDNADKISFDIHQSLVKSKAEIKLKKVNVGQKNALDFQLAAYLGYAAAKNEKNNYYIVSNDNGYCVLCGFWTNISVKTISSIQDGICTAPPDSEENTNVKYDEIKTTDTDKSILEYEISIKQSLTKICRIKEASIKPELAKIIKDENEMKWILKYVNDNFERLKEREEKVRLNNLLGKRYTSGIGGKIYRVIQTAYKEKMAETEQIKKIINKTSEIEWLACCINETHIKIEKNKQKSNIHNSLREKYGNDLGAEIYKAIKSVV